MKQLKTKNGVYQYERDCDSECPSNYTYSLYDAKGRYISSSIISFKGVRAIAAAYAKGEKEFRLEEKYWCFG